MIHLTIPIQIEVSHRFKKAYTVDGLQLTDNDGYTIIFKTYADMAKYLGISRQALYNKIRDNMHPLDALSDQIQNRYDTR